MSIETVKLLTAILLFIAAIIPLAREIVILRRERRARPAKLPPRRRVIRRPWFLVGILLLVGAVVFFTLVILSCKDVSKYGFEEGTMGWIQQTFEDSQGVISVSQSSEQAKLCRYSLKLTADLEGGHPNRTKGEAFVEISQQSLENKPITVWVYVPKEALGDPRAPNGIQVFVKDKDWRSEYGAWWNITPGRVDSWQQITLTPGRLAPPDGYMEPGFDPTQIRAVGVKVAINDKSTAAYNGPIYIDAVDWPR